MKKRHIKPYRYARRPSRRPRLVSAILVTVVLSAIAYFYGANLSAVVAPSDAPLITAKSTPDRGRILSVDSVRFYSSAEAAAASHENYGATTPLINTGITKVTFRYRSYDVNGTPLSIYGRAYLPEKPAGKLPVFAFASGTTGIGDKCAPSLEQPKVSNWANYDSHLITYASQGYAAVITDYEGMRDDTRIHHYMVGELEGRAVLDSVRAMRRLPQAAGRTDASQIFLSGYSQGGHAAYWADKIQSSYAPELTIKGVVGFGPVMSVKDTLADVTHAANINWFGPYVLTSYSDYYGRNYGTSSLLLPQWVTHLSADVQGHCIDTVLPFWGYTAQGVYTSQFIQDMADNNWSAYPELSKDLDRNLVGDQKTTSAKRINQGQFDNVVLPRQQEAIVPLMCSRSRGPVQYVVYPNTTHYNTMVHSLNDTLAWMRDLRANRSVAGTCSNGR